MTTLKSRIVKLEAQHYGGPDGPDSLAALQKRIESLTDTELKARLEELTREAGYLGPMQNIDWAATTESCKESLASASPASIILKDGTVAARL